MISYKNYICSVLLLLSLDVCMCSHCICKKTNNTLSLICNKPSQVEIDQCLETNKDAISVLITNSGLTTIPPSIALLSKIKHLNLAHNHIQKIDDYALNSIGGTLQTLVMDYNNVTVLQNGTLDNLTNLLEISLQHNGLQEIEIDAISSNFEALHNIQFSHNRLTSVDLSLIFMPAVFKGIEVRVNLSDNDVSNGTNHKGFTISEISINNSFFVDLTRNNFTTIDINYFLHLVNVQRISDLYNLGSAGLSILYNPLVCDCRLFPFSFYINIFRFMDPYNPIFTMTCYNPPELRGRRIYNVRIQDFNCSVYESCPSQCLCKNTIALDLTTVVCDRSTLTSLPTVLPKGKKIQLSIHSKNVYELTDRSYFKNVTIFDASSSAISIIHEDFLHNFETIETIQLHDNQLDTLPEKIQDLNLENLTALYLHNNHYHCDCHTKWMKYWLKKNRNKIPDIEQVLCFTGPGKGKPIIDVSDSDFICDGVSITLILAVSFGGLSFLVFAIFMVYIFREPIQVFLIANYRCCECLRRKAATDLPFDVFLSYSSYDDAFVNAELIPYLENHECRLFTQDNFVPGKTITENILRGIDSSFTTLIVLSNRFLESDWCKYEFQQAYDKVLKERERYLIILILEEKLDKTLIQGTLNLYMTTNNYIKVSEKRYLSRLLLALPKMQVKTDASEKTPLLSDQSIQ